MKKFLLLCSLTVASLCISSCSVFMAAHKSGVSVDELSSCQTRDCIISKGAEPISSSHNKSGVVIGETYRVKKPTGSTARAVMHGVLDVSTFGIWEAVGTPMEGVMNQSEFYSIKVLYNDNGQDIKAVQMVR
jgi:hypothetical protein